MTKATQLTPLKQQVKNPKFLEKISFKWEFPQF